MYPPIGRGGLNAHFPHHHLCTTAATPSGSAPVLNSTTRPVSGDDVANKINREQLMTIIQRIADVVCLPSYDRTRCEGENSSDGGGLVLDRVLMSCGYGNNAYMTVTGRSKPQRNFIRINRMKRHKANRGSDSGSPTSKSALTGNLSNIGDGLATLLRCLVPGSVHSNFSVNSHKKKAAARVFIDVDLMRHISKRDTDVKGIKVTDTTEYDTQRSPSRNGNDKNWGLFNHFFRSTSDPECTDDNRMNRNGLENTKRGSVVRRIFSSRKVSGRASAIMKSVLGHELCMDASINSRYQNLLEDTGYTTLPFLWSLSIGNRQFTLNNKTLVDSDGVRYSIASRGDKKLSFLNYRLGYVMSTSNSVRYNLAIPHTSEPSGEAPKNESTNGPEERLVDSVAKSSSTLTSRWQAGASLEHHMTLLGGRIRRKSNDRGMATIEKKPPAVIDAENRIRRNYLNKSHKNKLSDYYGNGKMKNLSPICGPQHLTVGGSIGYLARSTLQQHLSSNHPFHAIWGATTSSVSDALKKTLVVHPFFSGGLSFQIGKFSRNFFDYASMSIRFDYGPYNEDTYQSRRRIITSSASMQLVGPTRLRVQTIFEPVGKTNTALQSTSRPVIFSKYSSGETTLPTLSPLLVHDISVGVDILPRLAGGAVRLLTWVAPFRREAMFEVRLWEQ